MSQAQTIAPTALGEVQPTSLTTSSVASKDTPCQITSVSTTTTSQEAGPSPRLDKFYITDRKGHAYQPMWTGDVDSEFFQMQGLSQGDSTEVAYPVITVKEGYVTSSSRFTLDSQWKAKAVEVGEYIANTTKDEELRRWFLSPDGNWRPTYTRLVDAAAIEGFKGRRRPALNPTQADTSQPASNFEELRLPSEERLSQSGRQSGVRYRKRVIRRLWGDARQRGRECMDQILEICQVAVEEAPSRGFPDESIKLQLERANMEFLKGYHYWRDYRDPALRRESEGRR